MIEQPQAYTVSAITRIIKNQLEEAFPGVWIQGEISNYLHHSSGHRYFNLKDAKAVLKVVIWRSVGSRLKFEPKNGQNMLAFGDITVYEKGGVYQLNCRKLVTIGIGELELAFRQLKEKLAGEGLFDEDLKKLIPEYPLKIGIVTSPTGAAIRDIIKIARRRNNAVALVLFPAQVQGDTAEFTIKDGIEYFNSRDDIDIIIIGRGGGSLEDLWPFNTETVVRAIVASQIPIISAVGHEIDTTLSDLAADQRAATPSAAAELCVWSSDEFSDWINSEIRRQSIILQSMIRHARERLMSIFKRPVMTRPAEIIQQYQQHLDHIQYRLVSGGKNSFEKHRNRLSLVLSQIDALSPLKVLQRGYTVTRKLPDNKVLQSVRDVSMDDSLETVLNDGTVLSLVKKVRKNR